MAVMTAVTRRPSDLPVRCRLAASASASASERMNAPLPVLTSNTSASAPSANFFERMLAVMSGMDSTVAVTSRSAYILRSAGTIRSLCPIIAKPASRRHARNSSADRSVR